MSMRSVQNDSLFPRRFGVQYPVAVRADGVYVYAHDGTRYLDACGGPAVVTIGYGVTEVADEIGRVARELSYVHTSQFHTRIGEQLAGFLAERFPGPGQHVRVLFASSGSEATETAMKLVRQHWLSRGEPRRVRILARWHGYHGATLGALALSGDRRRRQIYEPLLRETEHVSPCFCYHCPYMLEYPSCELACARDLEQVLEQIEETDPGSVAAFICEPIVGATSGAVPPDDYLRLIREICDRFGVLLIADEVLTGAGRTGRFFAVEHWDVVADIILLGKGLTSGYAPLSAVLVAEHVWRGLADEQGRFEHGFTYQAHPPSVAAGLAVQRYVAEHGLIDRARELGDYLAHKLERLRDFECVGDIRGKGLLQTVEFVADRRSRAPRPAGDRFVEQVFDGLCRRGVMTYPVRGTVDGLSGEHIMLAPPFVITEPELDVVVEQLAEAIAEVG